MSVLIVNSKDDGGGAARASHRLCVGLRDQNVDASMLVRKRTRNHHFIQTPNLFKKWYARLRPALDGLMISDGLPGNSAFSLNRLPDWIPQSIDRISPDIVHLHWIGAGYLQPESLANINQPLVWTLHDMWPFTGGCHYSYGCNKYESTCHRCPILNSSQEEDQSYNLHMRKKEAWKFLDLTLLSPSQWLADCARDSSLFNEATIHVVRNGIDTSEFKPIPKRNARRSLGLPGSEKIILFIGGLSGTSRKGQQFVRKLLREDWKGFSHLLLSLGGHEDLSEETDWNLSVNQLGYLSDEELKMVYSAADLLLIPSLADNQPNTILEAMACETPCVAFESGGIPEIIQHKKDGYLAGRKNVLDLKRGIEWMFECNKRLKRISKNARITVENEFSLAKSVESHRELYSKIKC